VLFTDNYGVDFTGTTLVAEGDTLTIQEIARTDEGYRVRARCDADGPASNAELRVKVMAGADVRYQDAFDVHCLVATDVVLPFLQPRMLAGTQFTLNAVVHGTDVAGKVFASGGHGWTVEPIQGPFGLSDEDAPGTLELTALSAGSGAFLVAGNVRVEVPVEVVEDWQLGLTLDLRNLATSNVIHVDTEAVDADGGQVSGLTDCTFTVEVGAYGEADGGLSDGGLYLEPTCVGDVSLGRDVQRAHICAAQGTRQRCQDVTP
jgi:hypothetical protein